MISSAYSNIVMASFKKKPITVNDYYPLKHTYNVCKHIIVMHVHHMYMLHACGHLVHEGSEGGKDVCLQCERLVDLQEREESGEVLHHQQVVPLLSTELRLGGGGGEGPCKCTCVVKVVTHTA